MAGLRRFSVLVMLSMVCISACKAKTQAPPPPTPITSLDAAQGGKIVYGTVAGASTQAEAMSKVLRVVHDNCGDRPQVGKVFQFKGTNTVGVFFTVTNHAQNNTPVAGLVISSVSGPHQVDAALVSDRASRFGKTVNSMLQQLFSVWTPGGKAAASSAAFGGNSDSAGGQSAPASGHSAGAAQLHTVVLPDRSASVGVPDGWKVDGGGGTMYFSGPRGEYFLLNAAYTALDPRNPAVRQGIQLNRQYGGGRPDTNVYLPYGVNVPQAFVTLFADGQRRNHNPPVSFQISNSSQIPGQPCIRLEGTVTNSANGISNEFFGIFCEQQSQSGNGIWSANLHMAWLPKSLAVEEHATAQAILSSFQVNQRVVNAIAAPGIAAINQIGRDATARYNAQQAANDAQHAGYWAQQNANAAQHSEWNAGQDNNARNNQGFSNYLLDQTVVEDNNVYGNGTVGHGTVYNSTADALIKADPNRYSSVDTPNYWQGTDY